MGLVDHTVLPAFLLAMVLVELTPGPNMAYLAALSLQRGRLAGFAAVAGVTLGLAVYLAASVLGLTELIIVWPPAYEALRWAGVGYMLWLAWEAWRGGEAGPELAQPAGSMAVLVGRGFLANVLNPKAALFYVTLLPGFIRPGFASPPVQAATFGLGHLAISLVVHSAIVLAASRAGVLLAAVAPGAPLRRIRQGLAMSLVLVAAWLAWETRR